MPELPVLSGSDMISALERAGFEVARQRGSHVVMKKHTDSGVVGCVVPLHKELAKGTLRGILKQARIEPEEFIGLLS